MIKQAAHLSSFEYIGRLFSQNRKKAVMYGLLCVVISVNFSLFFFAGEQWSQEAYKTMTAVRLTCFAVMGVVNVYFFYRLDLFPELATQETKLAFNGLLFIAVALVLFIFYTVAANHAVIMAMADSGAFLLPFLVCQAWIAFTAIPMSAYLVWYLPPLSTTAHTTVDSMQVQLKILRRANDKSPDTYPVTASVKLSPGTIFSIFVAGRPIHGSISDIQLADDRQQSFGWLFYEEKWGGLYKRNLDPSISLFSNRVKPNAKILILRASQPN